MTNIALSYWRREQCRLLGGRLARARDLAAAKLIAAEIVGMLGCCGQAGLDDRALDDAYDKGRVIAEHPSPDPEPAEVVDPEPKPDDALPKADQVGEYGGARTSAGSPSETEAGMVPTIGNSGANVSEGVTVGETTARQRGPLPAVRNNSAHNLSPKLERDPPEPKRRQVATDTHLLSRRAGPIAKPTVERFTSHRPIFGGAPKPPRVPGQPYYEDDPKAIPDHGSPGPLPAVVGYSQSSGMWEHF